MSSWPPPVSEPPDPARRGRVLPGAFISWRPSNCSTSMCLPLELTPCPFHQQPASVESTEEPVGPHDSELDSPGMPSSLPARDDEGSTIATACDSLGFGFADGPRSLPGLGGMPLKATAFGPSTDAPAPPASSATISTMRSSSSTTEPAPADGGLGSNEAAFELRIDFGCGRDGAGAAHSPSFFFCGQFAAV